MLALSRIWGSKRFEFVGCECEFVLCVWGFAAVDEAVAAECVYAEFFDDSRWWLGSRRRCVC